MGSEQRVSRRRRHYNQWVGNQTLEDFALRFTAQRARRWSAFRVGNTAIGAVSFLACEAIGGSITLAFGFTNAMAATAATGIVMFLVGLPICLAATRHGVDVDLLTRGAGFGYIGSTITSLIYATFTFILFSIEASIMSSAITMVVHLPFWLANVISALIVIPIAAFGIRAISRVQLWTQPLWLALQFGPLVFLAARGLPEFSRWTQFTGNFGHHGLALLPFGMAASILLSLLPQVGEQVDYLRFLPERAGAGRFAWWSAMLFTGPGWVFTGCAKLAVGSFLTYLAIAHGVAWHAAAQPATMFKIAFLALLGRPAVASALMLLFVVTCQIKINITNAYAGSIAWSNFFSRLTHSHPGRVVWVVFNVLLALILMEIGIFRVIQSILGLYADFAVGWMGALAADLVINKPLGLSPPGIEFKRAHLYDVNPVGVGAMALSVLVSSCMSFNLFGQTAHALAPFAGLLIAFITAPIIAYGTGGRYYLARAAEPLVGAKKCVICETSFEPQDMATCPAYGGHICSLCCSLDSRCRDLCKPHGRISEQLQAFFRPVVPSDWMKRIDRQILHFVVILGLFSLVIAAVTRLIGFEYGSIAPLAKPVIHETLQAVSLVFFILSAVAAWLLVLAHESRRIAEEETGHQTSMLMDEVTAHERTDAALEKARATAESANTAKSRYLVGVIHEIRAPLNAIFGYAQLLESSGTLRPADAVRTIRRSAEHLSSMVDGLLDISQIETGALQLHRDLVNFPEFLDQIVDMFRLLAAAKKLKFSHERIGSLPRLIHTDEKRVRQILINLLSNAVKYTNAGEVMFRVRLRGQVTEFEVADSGLGIRAEDMMSIFEPFERGHLAAANAVPGTGLGLTISKLLTQILGGEISVESSPGAGSRFRVRMLLSEARGQAAVQPERRIMAYEGRRQKILIADDDRDHVELLTEILQPLGFIVLSVDDGASCVAACGEHSFDLTILDIAMPGISGLDVAKRLREYDEGAKILIISGNFHDTRRLGKATGDQPYDAFLTKPIDIQALLEKIVDILHIKWVYDASALPAPVEPDPSAMQRPGSLHLNDLLQLGRIGYVRGIEAKLDEIIIAEPDSAAFCNYLRDLVHGFQLPRYTDYLETLPEMRHNG